MPLPIIAGIVGRAALQYAMRARARYAVTAAARRAALGAARQTINRGIQRGSQQLQREITRRRNCRTCKQLDELVRPCAVLSGGMPGNTASHRGGSHNANRRRGRAGIESNHMPASDAYPANVSTGQMPAIQMDIAHHRRTASWGSSTAARQYRAEQRRLISRGRMREAFLMDVMDIRAEFGSEYDSAIAEAAAYMECLNQYKDKYNLPGGRRRRRR